MKAIRPEDQKRRIRGATRDMSSSAISRRFDILVDLHQVARTLSQAKRLGKARDTSTDGWTATIAAPGWASTRRVAEQGGVAFPGRVGRVYQVIRVDTSQPPRTGLAWTMGSHQRECLLWRRSAHHGLLEWHCPEGDIDVHTSACLDEEDPVLERKLQGTLHARGESFQ